MLLRYIRGLLTPDDNTGGESSTPPNQEGQQGSTETQESIASVAKKAFDESQAAEAEGAVQEEDKTGEEEEGQGEQETGEAEEGQQDPDAKLPFNEHPRWKEVLRQRDDYKTKFEEHEARMKQFEPAVQEWHYHQQFLQENGISNEDFANAMNFLAFRNTDPLKAREALRPIWDSLQEYDPEVLPKDLAERVKTGEINETAAKEIAALRAKTRGVETRTKATQQQQAQRQQNAIVNALGSWDSSKRKSDPSFKPKVNGGKDGLYELTLKNYAFLQQTNPPRSEHEAIQMVEQAYNDAKTFLTPDAKRIIKPPLTSRQSSRTATAEPKSIRDVVRNVARQHGL